MALIYWFWLSCMTAVAIDAAENAQLPDVAKESLIEAHPVQKTEHPQRRLPVTFITIEPTTYEVFQNPATSLPPIPVTQKPDNTLTQESPQPPPSTRIPTTEKRTVTESPEPTPKTDRTPIQESPEPPPSTDSVTQNPQIPSTQIHLTYKQSATEKPSIPKSSISTPAKPGFGVPCRCEAHGDPHYKTFDNSTFSLLFDCSFIMSQAISDNGICDFRVEVENERRPTSAYKRRAFTNLVKVIIKGNVVTIGQGQTVEVNSVPVVLPYDQEPFYVRIVGDYVTVTSSCGVKVEFDGDSSARVTVPRMMFRGQLSGLCGDCDGDRMTDWLPETRGLRHHMRVRALAKEYALKCPEFS